MLALGVGWAAVEGLGDGGLGDGAEGGESASSPPSGRPSGAIPKDASLSPGEAVILTMTFALPDECPPPYPVRVDVAAMTEPGGRVFHTELGVLNDLGGSTFRRCREEQ